MIRYYQDFMATLGILIFDDYNGMPIFTLENPYKKNEPKISCIPEGKYKCDFFRKKNDRHSYIINGVNEPNVVELKACSLLPQDYGNILIGHGINNSNYDPIVTNGTRAVNIIRDYFNEESFILNIENRS